MDGSPVNCRISRLSQARRSGLSWYARIETPVIDALIGSGMDGERETGRLVERASD
jgi:hypothetical protein